VLALERSVFPVPWTEEMLRAEVKAPGRNYLVVDGEVGPTAYGGLMVTDVEAHIMTIAVHKEYRGNGIATRLLLALIDSALDTDVKHLTLELRVSNQPAFRLYEKFGFAPVGIKPRYYVDEDALVMWAVGISGPEYRRRLDRIREGVQ